MIKISGKKVGEGFPAFIIAEAGVNHNGDLAKAKRMVDMAKRAGADAIKFQTYITDQLVVAGAPKAEYQKKHHPKQSQHAMLKKFELAQSDFFQIAQYCKRKKIIFMSTPFDPLSAEFLQRLGVSAFKISSGELNNYPLILQIARYGKPMIVSTGMSSLDEVRKAVRMIRSTGNRKYVLLHCTSTYPARSGDVNLKAMETLRNAFKAPVGYSDHTLGIEISVAAVARGACVIEKHFTLDRSMAGPDHKASLDPESLGAMVKAIRNIESAMGDGIKRLMKAERNVRSSARKSVVAAHAIPKNTMISEKMIAIKRPGTGIEPKYISKIIGRRVKRDIKGDQIIQWSSLR